MQHPYRHELGEYKIVSGLATLNPGLGFESMQGSESCPEASLPRVAHVSAQASFLDHAHDQGMAKDLARQPVCRYRAVSRLATQLGLVNQSQDKKPIQETQTSTDKRRRAARPRIEETAELRTCIAYSLHASSHEGQ